MLETIWDAFGRFEECVGHISRVLGMLYTLLTRRLTLEPSTRRFKVRAGSATQPTPADVAPCEVHIALQCSMQSRALEPTLAYQGLFE